MRSSFLAIIDGNTFTLQDTIQTNHNTDDLIANDDLSMIYENNSAVGRVIRINAQGHEVERKTLDATIDGTAYFEGNTLSVFNSNQAWMIDLSDYSVFQNQWTNVPIQNIVVDRVHKRLNGYSPEGDGSMVSYSLETFDELDRIRTYSYAYPTNFTWPNGVLYAKGGYKLRMY